MILQILAFCFLATSPMILSSTSSSLLKPLWKTWNLSTPITQFPLNLNLKHTILLLLKTPLLCLQLTSFSTQTSTTFFIIISPSPLYIHVQLPCHSFAWLYSLEKIKTLFWPKLPKHLKYILCLHPCSWTLLEKYSTLLIKLFFMIINLIWALKNAQRLHYHISPILKHIHFHT